MFSMNCRGLGEQKKRRDVLHYIRNLNLNVVFLQETHMTTDNIPYFNNLWNGKCYHACHTSRSRGSCILFSRNTQHELIKEIRDDSGNFMIVICKISTEVFAFINVYGPNRDQPQFFVEIFSKLEDIEIDNIITGGDMNFIIDPEADSLNYVRDNNVNAKQAFVKIANDNNLVDIWRHFNQPERKYTWTRTNPFKCGRLDMFFISEHLISSVRETNIVTGYRTDHCAITLSVKIKQHARGNGLWMFNVSHLSSDEYRETVKQCIYSTVKQYAAPVYHPDVYTDNTNYSTLHLTISESVFYETLIMMIRGESVRFAKQAAKRRKAKEDELKKDIERAQQQFNHSALESDLEHVKVAQNKLEELRKPLIEGLIVRSRVAWHENGERSSKYFLSLEKRNSCKNSIQYINIENKTVSKTSSILDVFSRHFASKYSKTPNVDMRENIVPNYIKAKLSSTDRNLLDSEITIGELTKALQTMKKGKTPGSNGFPVEFFRTFWSELAPFLHRAFIASLTQREALPSHRVGIIKLIPKQGKPPQEIKSWRPITLLNVDYKIVSTAIANRFKKIIDQIISPCQTAYIKNRYIGENTRLLFDTIAFANKKMIPGIIVAADFEGAFESISWEYLRLVMDTMNFGPYFLRIIDLLYLNPQNYSRIMISGHLGPEVHLQQGIRQGDPSSGFLFNIAAEVLTGLINQSAELSGLTISPSKQVRISQYADDTILFLDGTTNSIEAAMNELVKFGKVSGLKVNLEKTSGLPIGSLKQTQITTNFNMKIVRELKVLGTTVSNNVVEIAEKNIRSKISAIHRDIKQWKRRHLTPLGKICIIKSLLLSKLVHLFMALPNPSSQCIKEIETALFNFLWDGKCDKIKRKKLVQSYERDGLNMVDIRSFLDSMKLSWLKRLMTSKADWTHIAGVQLPNPAQLITYGKEKLKSIKNKASNPFYIDVIDALIRFNIQYVPSNEEILTETIWFSEHSNFALSIVKNWDKRGLRFICDLFNPINGRLLTKEEIENRYQIRMTFLCYERLVRKIPQNLAINTGMRIEHPNIPYKLQAVLNKTKFSKHAYNIFVNTTAHDVKKSERRVKGKWQNEIGHYSTGTFNNVSKATKSSFLRYLHYKIISRIFPTNKLLFAMKIKASDRCSFCLEAKETLTHLFWYCPKVKQFITQLSDYLKERYNKIFDINVTNWFFPRDLPNIDVLLITLSKAIIHRSRLNGSTPTLQAMLDALLTEARIECNAHTSNNQLEKFRLKWGELTKILE